MAKKIYLAGKITGDKGYKEKFARYQAYLEKLLPGTIVMNPAEMPEDEPLTYYARSCCDLVCQCDAVWLLPDWHESNGACLERKLARYLGKEIRAFRSDPWEAEK